MRLCDPSNLSMNCIANIKGRVLPRVCNAHNYWGGKGADPKPQAQCLLKKITVLFNSSIFIKVRQDFNYVNSRVFIPDSGEWKETW